MYLRIVTPGYRYGSFFVIVSGQRRPYQTGADTAVQKQTFGAVAAQRDVAGTEEIFEFSVTAAFCHTDNRVGRIKRVIDVQFLRKISQFQTDLQAAVATGNAELARARPCVF